VTFWLNGSKSLVLTGEASGKLSDPFTIALIDQDD